MNILRDHAFNFTPGGADDGAYTATTPVVSALKIDIATFRRTRTVVDTSTGMDETPRSRIVKTGFVADFETKIDEGTILRDLAVTLTPGGADDLAYTAGTSITTLKFDSIRIRQETELYDDSTEMNETPLMRTRKRPWTITFRTKQQILASTGLENMLKTNELIGFEFTHAPAGELTVSGHGTLVEDSYTFESPDMVEFTIENYKTALSVAHDDTDGIISLLVANAVFKADLLNTLATTALDVSLTGIQSFVELQFGGGPSMIRWGMQPYGVAPSLAFA